MLLQVMGSGFSISELAQFFAFAFAAGGLAMAVRSHDKRLTSLETKREEDIKAFSQALRDAMRESEERHERREERSIQAMEHLSTSIQELNTKLEVVVATHDQRLSALEKE